MLFSSIFFLFTFLPAVLALYFASPEKLRNPVLFTASIVFYSWGEPVYVFLMLFSAAFNYSMALDIGKEQERGGSGRFTLIFTVVINLFILCFFKYYGFFMDTVNAIFNSHLTYTALPLPIGISFYTFQALSYIFDVYRKNVTVQKSLLKFSLYLSLFPQLIAGPIIKYRDIEAQLDSRTVTPEGFGRGARRFILGLGKKVVLANNFGMAYAAVTAMENSRVSVVSCWIGIIAYTLQICFDFGGYSDMAIGLSNMFGFDFPENFNYPYISKSVTEFWRRWHISLSTWFRDYLYIPLGGNRVKPLRHVLNLMAVWTLTGLWHGADWNFIIWGVYYGALLVIEKYFLGKYLEKSPVPLRRCYTLLAVVISWVFFSIPDLGAAGAYLRVMFCMGGAPFANTEAFYLFRTNFLLILLGGAMATKGPITCFDRFYNAHQALGILILLSVLVLSAAYLIFTSYNPFLYFRF